MSEMSRTNHEEDPRGKRKHKLKAAEPQQQTFALDEIDLSSSSPGLFSQDAASSDLLNHGPSSLLSRTPNSLLQRQTSPLTDRALEAPTRYPQLQLRGANFAQLARPVAARPLIQAKLAIGSTYDAYEQEADRVTGQRTGSEFDGGFRGELDADSTASLETTRDRAGHGSGCGCANCRQASRSNPASASRGASITSRLTQVIQRDWICSECGFQGPGKPKNKCPECGSKGTLEEVQGKQSFGNWWAGLGDAGRQKLLREHGSHEAAGGHQQKYKGGGKKGNQHDVGTANAMQQIKKKYEAGDYD